MHDELAYLCAVPRDASCRAQGGEDRLASPVSTVHNQGNVQLTGSLQRKKWTAALRAARFGSINV